MAGEYFVITALHILCIYHCDSVFTLDLRIGVFQHVAPNLRPAHWRCTAHTTTSESNSHTSDSTKLCLCGNSSLEPAGRDEGCH